MKKKFISVAMFCALIASTAVWVGCSDYDDDIANLQSQVDALKQTVDVSTAEALKALQEAQAALQEDASSPASLLPKTQKGPLAGALVSFSLVRPEPDTVIGTTRRFQPWRELPSWLRAGGSVR